MRGQVGLEAKKLQTGRSSRLYRNSASETCISLGKYSRMALHDGACVGTSCAQRGSLIAGVVAAIKHIWLWIIAVLASILLILQWGGTYEGC
jgi:hypothetical protein